MSANPDASNKPDPIINSLLLEMTWINLENTMKMKENLENKANFILVASGVLLGIQLLTYGEISKIFVAIISLSFIITAILAILVLRIGDYPMMDVMETWKALKAEGLLNKPEEAQSSIFATLNKVIRANIAGINERAKYYQCAFLSFVFSLALLASGIYFSLLFGNVIP